MSWDQSIFKVENKLSSHGKRPQGRQFNAAKIEP